MSERDDLIQKAEDAITAVFSDRSVSQTQTEQDLEDLQDFVSEMLDTLE